MAIDERNLRKTSSLLDVFQVVVILLSEIELWFIITAMFANIVIQLWKNIIHLFGWKFADIGESDQQYLDHGLFGERDVLQACDNQSTRSMKSSAILRLIYIMFTQNLANPKQPSIDTFSSESNNAVESDGYNSDCKSLSSEISVSSIEIDSYMNVLKEEIEMVPSWLFNNIGEGFESIHSDNYAVSIFHLPTMSSPLKI